MKTLDVRLPASLADDIEIEAASRGVSKSDVIRDRLRAAAGDGQSAGAPLAAIADLVGSIDTLPPTLSSNRKAALGATRATIAFNYRTAR